ncbi:hypothetical protein NCS56_00185100 [Fusarium sp. Ph1]|nr:hypothetical protein NCS56_00185100 [Fusarium sp. Ph1]
MSVTSTADLPPPPSSDKINIAIADLVIYILLLFPVIRITWRHGKSGMVCWPIFLSYFPLRFVSDAYQIANRDEPEIPNAVAIMTNAGSIACLSLTIIGLIYEVNVILPLPPKRWTERIMLAVTHLAITAGIALATYGGAPKAGAKGGVVAENLNQTGNCLMMFTMIFGLGWWLWQTKKRVMSLKSHPNFEPGKYLLLAACAALPFQLIRIGYNLTMAFTPYAVIDPFSGSFASRLLLMFGTQLCVAIAVTVGGWMSVGLVPAHALGQENQGFSRFRTPRPWV